MAFNRNAFLLCALVFLAFGFQTVGVFTSPLSKSKLALATTSEHYYGVFGYCKVDDDSLSCTGYTVGYDIDDSELEYVSSSNGRKILTEILLSHVVAAGLQLVSLLLACGTLWTNLGWYIFVLCFFVFTFLVTALSFIVEILLFRVRMQFAAWFTLAATVLSIVYIVFFGLCFRDAQRAQAEDSASLDEEHLLDSGKGFFMLDDDKTSGSFAELADIKGPYNVSNHSLESSALSNASQDNLLRDQRAPIVPPRTTPGADVPETASHRSMDSSVYNSASEIYGDRRAGTGAAGSPSKSAVLPAGAYVQGVESVRVRQGPNNLVRMPISKPPTSISHAQAQAQLASVTSSGSTPAAVGAAAASTAASASAAATTALAGAGLAGAGTLPRPNGSPPRGPRSQPGQTAYTQTQERVAGAKYTPPQAVQSDQFVQPVPQPRAWQQQQQQQQQRAARPAAQPAYYPQQQGYAQGYAPASQQQYAAPAQQYAQQYAQGYAPQYAQQYAAPTQQYAPQYAQQYAPRYAQPAQAYAPAYAPVAAQPVRQAVQTSDFALQSNPDFSVPGKNRRRPRPM